ncbi:acyltransferase [Halobacillus naozhouensis]|uniref:Acyltransferase family protein n=1 Tax=Halobacillus naozhouensis TaxID=554880 RepID=A0ABY8IV53_9BACI|nr:acyltransferase family protein [Halobacillus naozhouensis]WFT73825.1 acyltransferase family protein [Halobacillus naozhouensis]
MGQAKERLISIDLLRFLAICAVVVLHCAAPLLYEYNGSGPKVWWLGNILDSISRWCVPVFVMISGAFILKPYQNQQSLTKFLKKRLTKILLPFIFWSILFLVYKEFHTNSEINLAIGVKQFLTGDVYYHLWFVYMIVGLYLIAPIFQIFISKTSEKYIIYLLVLWFISSIIYPFVMEAFEMNIRFDIPATDGFLGYFLLGYYLMNYHIKNKYRVTLYFLGIGSIFVTIFGTWYLTVVRSEGTFRGYFFDNHSPNVFFVAVALFLLFKYMNMPFLEESPKIRNLILIASGVSFGIYMIHPIIQNTITRYIPLTEHSFVSVPLVAVMVISISFGIIYLMQQNKITKKLVL